MWGDCDGCDGCEDVFSRWVVFVVGVIDGRLVANSKYRMHCNV